MSENNYKDFWQFAMEQIKQEYKNNGQESDFNLWYNIKYIEDSSNKISAEVPSDFMWKMMNDRHNIENIIKHIESLSGQSNIQIVPVVKNSSISNETTEPEIIVKTENISPTETTIKKENTSSAPKNSTLDSKYTFDNFITGEGSSSNFAYKVAMAVAKEPGVDKTNPILLYGGVGLGKTHLMQAIGNEILKNYGNEKKILYIQAESFTNEFTNSIAIKNPKKFNDKYRNLDVLLIDDIQFLQGKESTQEALFYIFEALKLKFPKAQMVFTCDRPLREIENLTDRLQSRLGSGMCLDLQPPTFETRKAIILKKLEIEGKKLSEPVIDLIANTVQTNIRDLEGALKKILGYSEFIDTEITPEIAINQLSDYVGNEIKGNISIENIMKVVANNYNISVSDMKSSKRQQKLVIPRHIALYIAYNLTEYTFSDLGYEFGGRDHSSIMHACEKIEKTIKTDPSLKQKIEYLIKEIKEYK